jgi:hypothetical protein
MLELVRTLFEPGQARSRSESPAVDHPRFDPDLVDQLSTAQAGLLGSIAELSAGSRARNFVASMSALERLDRGLRAYLADTAALFNEHLWRTLRRDAGALALMRGVCAHLDELARYVSELVTLNRLGQLSPRDFDRVAQELESLGQALEHCLQTQADRLFPLYRPIREAPARQFGRLIAM